MDTIHLLTCCGTITFKRVAWFMTFLVIMYVLVRVRKMHLANQGYFDTLTKSHFTMYDPMRGRFATTIHPHNQNIPPPRECVIVLCGAVGGVRQISLKCATQPASLD